MPPVNDRARLSGRSAVSNGTRLFLEETGIDYRTLTIRRFKDLIRTYSDDYEITTEADQSLVRMAAALALKAEQMQAALVRGEPVDSDKLNRLTGTLHRALAPAAPVADHWLSTHDNDDEGSGA